MYKKVVDETEYATGTSFSGYLKGISYSRLVEVFGEPTHPNPSGDNKIQKEWNFIDGSGSRFTIYDYKTYDLDITLNHYTDWHVGSRVSAVDFISWVESKLSKQI
jgi:hypothetical protein